jgi:hypothetical protein
MIKLRQRLLLVLGSVLLALVLAEACLRLFLPLSLKRERYVRTRNVYQYGEGNVQFDAGLGFFNTPNHTTVFSNPEFTTIVTTNSAGFRDDETSLQHPDVLLLGDSIGFGWGVEKDQTVEAQLEKLLGVRVLNLSVSGYGTIQEAILFERWLALHPDDHQTRLAIFLFYRNDLNENVQPYFALYPNLFKAGNKVVASAATPGDFRDWLAACRREMTRGPARYSYVADYALDVWHKITGAAPALSPIPFMEGFARVDDPIEAFQLITSQIKNVAEQRGMRVLFAYVPSINSFEQHDDDRVAAFVRETSLAQGFAYTDLHAVLTSGDYYHLDDHLRPAGQEKIARQLQKVIEEKNLLASPVVRSSSVAVPSVTP